MNISEVRLGMVVEANESSNNRYLLTTAEHGCVGIVTDINKEKNHITIKVIEHDMLSKVGHYYSELRPEYFDCVVDSGRIEVELKDERLMNIGIGDLIVDEEGTGVLIMVDYNYKDYRGIILDTNIVTQSKRTVEDLIDLLRAKHGFGNVKRVVKAEHLKLSEV